MEVDFSKFNWSRLMDRFFDPEVIGRWIDDVPRALWRTIQLATLAEVFGIALGLFLALGAIHRRRTVRAVFRSWIELWRGTPLLVQLLFVHFSFPLVGIIFTPFVSGAFVLSLNSAAYVAEIFRAGIQSLERGQIEAARSLGMSYRRMLRVVVLPQAFRRVVPPLTNELVALVKDSSLVAMIGIVELLGVARLAFGAEYNSSMYPVVALLFLSITLPLTFLARALERRLSRRGAQSWVDDDRQLLVSLSSVGHGHSGFGG